MNKYIAFSALACALILSSCHRAPQITPEATVGTLVEALPAETWDCSQWISAVDAPVTHEIIQDSCRAADGASWFILDLSDQSSIINHQSSIQKATWMTASLGVMQLYANGQPVGCEFLRPGFTHYAKTKRSFTYDITEALQAGGQLSAQVTPGWWADKIITPAGNEGMFGRKCAFRAVLRLEYEDGTVQTIGTDTIHWRAGIAGPVTHAAIFDGEEYDARIPMGYLTPEQLRTPEINTEFAGEILPSNGAEVYLRYDLMLAPQKAYVYNDITDADATHHGRTVIDRNYRDGQTMRIHPGETLVIDFGQNCAAIPAFVFSAKEGTVLTCRSGELLNDSLGSHKRGMDGPEGSVHLKNLRIPNEGVKVIYTFANSPSPVAYIPHCTYFGYRYISVTATDELTLYAVRSIPVSSITEALETGTITTGNELVNRLILNTVWGMRSNYLSVPTDCPQRNERLGWTADTQVFCETGTFFANTDRFFHKWLRDLRDTQSATGSYPGVAPWGQYGANSWDCSRAGWADAGVIVPWAVWKQFGDTSLVNEHWASMERYIDRIASKHYDHTALFEDNGGYQWADWLGYEPLESCSGQPWDANGLRPEAAEYWSYLCGSYWVMDSEMMLDMARATGRDTAKFVAMIAKAKQYMCDRFLNEDGTFRIALLNTMQTPALFALRNQLVAGEAHTAMCARLRQNCVEHGQRLQTGFLGTSILMKTLTDNGMADIAYDLLFQRNDPSWLYSVDQGATTIWERWNSYTIESGMHPHGMNSFNHYSYGCVCQWLWQTAAGINADPLCPGFRHILLTPVPDQRLGHLKAEYHSAAGLITSQWRYDGDQCIWTFSIPEGTTATVTLPGDTESQEYKAGEYTLRF